MNPEEFAALLALGHELRGVEFKSPGLFSDSQLRARTIRAMLGMANRQDGGYVVIGVEESAGTLHPTGLTSDELASWKYDDISDQLSRYADPSVSFVLEIHEYQGRSIVVLIVHEFDDIPVICKRDYPSVLRAGACYVRSVRRPETSEIPTAEDMRRLLDLATTKKLRAFLVSAMNAGLIAAALPGGGPNDRERFDEQLRDLR
jgi:predicted HTH transcriptional regulator